MTVIQRMEMDVILSAGFRLVGPVVECLHNASKVVSIKSHQIPLLLPQTPEQEEILRIIQINSKKTHQKLPVQAPQLMPLQVV